MCARHVCALPRLLLLPPDSNLGSGGNRKHAVLSLCCHQRKWRWRCETGRDEKDLESPSDPEGVGRTSQGKKREVWHRGKWAAGLSGGQEGQEGMLVILSPQHSALLLTEGSPSVLLPR